MSRVAVNIRIGLALGVVSAMALTAGCTKANVAPSGPAFTTTFSGTVGVGGLVAHSLTSDRLGIATVTLTWSTNAVDLDFYATSNACTTHVGCPRRAFSDAVATTSEQLVFGISRDEIMKLWVQHFSGVAQAYAIEVSIQ